MANINDLLTTLAKRLRPLMVAVSEATLTAGEGPGIDIADNKVGLGGDTVLLYHADGNPVSEYATIAAALAAASSGDMVELPPQVFTENVTIPADVRLNGHDAVIVGTVTLSPNSVLNTNIVIADSSASTLKGVIGPLSGTASIEQSIISVINMGTGDAYGVSAERWGNINARNCVVEGLAYGGGDGYGGYASYGSLSAKFGWWSGSTQRFKADTLISGDPEIFVSSVSNTKALSLWNGSGNDAPPADWETVAFDDSAWSAVSSRSDYAVKIEDATTVIIYGPSGISKRELYRSTIAVPDIAILSATLYWDADDQTNGLYFNGTLVDEWPSYVSGDDHPVRQVDVTALVVPDSDNVIAFDQFDGAASRGACIVWKLVLNSVGSGIGNIYVHASEGQPVITDEQPGHGDRSVFDALNYADLHDNDVDTSASAHHHTLGTGEFQAAAGNHTHETQDVDVIEYLDTNISNPPTEDELLAAIGSPDTGNRGKLFHFNDNGAGLNEYLAIADGNRWWIVTLSKTLASAGIGFTVNASKSVATGGSPDWYGRATMEEIPGGIWVLVYQRSSAHATNDGYLRIRFSDDYGDTWTNENTDLDGNPVSGFPMKPPDCTASQDAGEPWLIIAPNGNLLLHMWRIDYGSDDDGTYQSISSDGGLTWSTPAAIDFSGVADDIHIFMTDDHFVYNGIIYAGARKYNGAGGASKSIFVKSEDNGATWEYISDISDWTTYPTEEVGLEYLGGTTILAILRHDGNSYTYKSVSTDMGATWGAIQNITSTFEASGRVRVKTRSHWRGFDNWWDDHVLLACGFQLMSPGNSMGRRNAIWISLDQGATWDGPNYCDVQTEDGGYGDMLWNPTAKQWVFVSYKGSQSAADLTQYNVTITGI